MNEESQKIKKRKTTSAWLGCCGCDT